MKSKSPVGILLGGLATVALLFVLLAGCATAPITTPAPASAPPTPTAPVPKPGASPALAPAPVGGTQPSLVTAGTQLKLTVVQPEDNTIIDTNKIEVKGTTGPGAVVSVNNEIATADSQGNFAVTITLEEGPNIVEVFTSDESGNEANLTLIVSYLKGG